MHKLLAVLALVFLTSCSNIGTTDSTGSNIYCYYNNIETQYLGRFYHIDSNFIIKYEEDLKIKNKGELPIWCTLYANNVGLELKYFTFTWIGIKPNIANFEMQEIVYLDNSWPPSRISKVTWTNYTNEK